MKVTTSATKTAWASGNYVGANRTMQRATIQRLRMSLFNYSLDNLTGWKEIGGQGKLASAIFGQASKPKELPNIKSINWSRSIDQDVATCTIVLYNTRPLFSGNMPTEYELDIPGYYTPGRGAAGNRWGYTANGWRSTLVPDRIIRTYEGYGFDHSVPPELDPHMYPSGVWLIDDVKLSPNGQLITLECRDLGRLLLDHIMFPPVIPWSIYPLQWEAFNTKTRKKASSSTGWIRPKYDTDSNIPYIGTGITDGGQTYVSSNGAVHGHHGRDAFDGTDTTYWMSVGNRPDWSSAYEYVQGKISSSAVAAVRVKTWAGPYKMYISVYANGSWQGAHKIPYRVRVIDTNADIPYVKAVNIGKGDDLTVNLPKTYTGVTKIRVTFSHLYNSGIGVNYRYRAGVRDFEVRATRATTVNQNYTVGNYGDYTDVIKWLCAWGGFFWPKHSTGKDYIHRSDGELVNVTFGSVDPVIGSGRVWGDFELTGTAGVANLTPETFDKRPLMDGINYVRDIIGFLFYIDERGGVIWRSPNVYKLGNIIWNPTGSNNGGRTSNYVTIDEKLTLLDLTPVASSKNIREFIFIGNASGGYAAVAAGYNPNPSGLRRVGGWSDQNFASDAECQKMADLITLRAAFEYRVSTIQIPGNPALQIDDQIKVIERITGESSFHRIRGITSSWDVESGKWTYDLETHWLGETPLTKDWAFDPAKLNALTQAYLRSQGWID